MKYQIVNTQRAVFFTECPINNPSISEKTGYKIYYTFSEAFDEFQNAVKRYSRVYYYSSRVDGVITIEATMENDLDLCQAMTGPYDDALVAYGVQRITNMIKAPYADNQFSLETHVIFLCQIHCDADYCIVRTTGPIETEINVTPDNDFSDIQQCTPMFLRIYGRSDDICVYNSPDELQDDRHLPPKIIIPVGSFHDDLADRDTSAVITGYVTQASVISHQDRLRYLLVVKTLAMEVNLDVWTHYEIHSGDFVYVKTCLSARC